MLDEDAGCAGEGRAGQGKRQYFELQMFCVLSLFEPYCFFSGCISMSGDPIHESQVFCHPFRLTMSLSCFQGPKEYLWSLRQEFQNKTNKNNILKHLKQQVSEDTPTLVAAVTLFCAAGLAFVLQKESVTWKMLVVIVTILYTLLLEI